MWCGACAVGEVGVALLYLYIFSLSPVTGNVTRDSTMTISALNASVSTSDITVSDVTVRRAITSSVSASMAATVPTSMSDLAGSALMCRLVPRTRLPSSLVCDVTVCRRLSGSSGFMLTCCP